MNSSLQFPKFLAVGAVSTAAHYLVLILLVRAIAADPVLASTAGYLFSALLNYGLNRQFTFASNRSHKASLPRFAFVVTSGLGLNALAFWMMSDALAAHYLVSQAVATCVTLTWNFSAARHWVFNSPTPLDRGAAQ